jgi:hypothetical protein
VEIFIHIKYWTWTAQPTHKNTVTAWIKLLVTFISQIHRWKVRRRIFVKNIFHSGDTFVRSIKHVKVSVRGLCIDLSNKRFAAPAFNFLHVQVLLTYSDPFWIYPPPPSKQCWHSRTMLDSIRIRPLKIDRTRIRIQPDKIYHALQPFCFSSVGTLIYPKHICLQQIPTQCAVW